MNRAPTSRRAAFTLLELLVSLGVLVIICLLVTKLVGATTDASRLSNLGVDAAAQARLTFDRLELDLGKAVRRSDCDFLVTNIVNPAAPQVLSFLTEVTSPGIAPADNRGISLVGYEIGARDSAPLPCLLRAGRPIAWAVNGLAGYDADKLPVPVRNLPIHLEPADFDVLAPAVIRVTFGFQLYPDNEEVTLADGRVIPNARGQIVYSPPVRKDADGKLTPLVNRRHISALIVGLVAMNPDTQKLVNAAQVKALAERFATPDQGVLPVAAWGGIADNVSGLPADIPLPARQSLRVFQRAFPITPFGSSL